MRRSFRALPPSSWSAAFALPRPDAADVLRRIENQSWWTRLINSYIAVILKGVLYPTEQRCLMLQTFFAEGSDEVVLTSKAITPVRIVRICSLGELYAYRLGFITISAGRE